jgi:hypothetical protein
MTTRRIFLLAAVTISACATPDPWPGTYEGETTTEARDCTSGAPYDDTQPQTVVIERGSAGLFISGRCLIELVELSERSARVEPISCDYALDDGAPVHVEIVEGRATLSGGHLALEYSSEVTSPGACLTALSMFSGDRL